MYKTVIFDLDGTLVNSIADLANSVNAGLQKAGLPVYGEEQYLRFVGNGAEKLIQRAMGKAYEDKRLKDMVRIEFQTQYNLHCNDNTRAYEGCEQMLYHLPKLGVMTGVLSNKPHEFVQPILDKAFPTVKFTIAWGKREGYTVKPDPKALLDMLKELQVPPEQCLYVGDSDVDVITARNANVDMVGVEWGFRTKEELLKSGAKTVVKHPLEILDILQANNNETKL